MIKDTLSNNMKLLFALTTSLALAKPNVDPCAKIILSDGIEVQKNTISNQYKQGLVACLSYLASSNGKLKKGKFSKKMTKEIVKMSSGVVEKMIEEYPDPDQPDMDLPPFDPFDPTDANNYVNEHAQVRVTQGLLQGQVRDNVMTFHGVPYAEPPIGDLRWRKPADKASWSGTLDVTRSIDQVTGCLNPIENLEDPDGKSESQSDVTSEDCLFLSMVVPSFDSLNKTGNTNRRPVIMHVHGAAFEYLTGSNNLFNGNYLANEEGAIVITINYRLGVFGYLGLSEAGELAPGNQALWDVIKALEWIKANIQYFYGDPENITLMGESSGAHLVSSLIAMKPNLERANLFQRGIIVSNPWMIGARTQGMNQGQGDSVATQLLSALNCGEDTNPMLCAKSKSSKEILIAAHQVNGATIEGFTDNQQPIVKVTTTISSFTEILDNDLLDMQTFDAFLQNRILDIDLITGINSGEGTHFVISITNQLLGPWVESEQTYNAVLSTIVKDSTPTVLANYPYPCGNKEGCNSQHMLGQVLGDYMFTCANFYVNQFLASLNKNNRISNSFMYLFDNPVPQSTQLSDWAQIPCSKTSCHGAALPYIFGSFQHDKYQRDEDRPAYTDTVQEDWDLSARMRKYWGNFLWSGNPNDSERPEGFDGEKNGNGESAISKSCWNDVGGRVCDDDDDLSQEYMVKHFVTGTDKNLETTVEEFRDICKVWYDLDAWMKY